MQQFLTHRPRFEYVSQRNKIVLDYDKDELILLALRHNQTGHYYPYDDMCVSAKSGGIRVTESLAGADFASSKEMIEQLHNRERCEGFVVQFENGAMYKVKTEWYFSRSNQKEKQSHSFNTERAVWELLLKQEFDDAAPLMDAILKAQVANFQVIEFCFLFFNCSRKLKQFIHSLQVVLFDAIGVLHKRLVDFCTPHLQLIKRDFVAAMQQAGTDLPAPLCFAVFDALKGGEDTLEVVVASAIKMCGNVKSLEVLRALLGNIRFSERIGPIDDTE
jgi:hypothetical protein